MLRTSPGVRAFAAVVVLLAAGLRAPGASADLRPNGAPILSPTSFVESRVPARPALDAVRTLTAPLALANAVASHGARFSTGSSVPVPYRLPATQPLVRVALVDSAGRLTAQSSTKARILEKVGVPIPAGFTPQPSPDGPATFYVPYWTVVDPTTGRTLHGMLWDLYRLRHARAPAAAAGFKWECQNAMRLLDLPHNPGHPVNRDPFPASLGQLRVAETVAGMGSTATKLPYLPLMSLSEDTRNWTANGVVPPHALGLAVPTQPATHRWPAQANDPASRTGSSAISQLEEGTRFWLPRSVDLAALHLHPLALMVAREAQEYGLVIWDHAASVSVRAQGSVTGYYNGTPATSIFARFPWTKLVVLAVGSDANPNP
jgi:hypothetical protein